MVNESIDGKVLVYVINFSLSLISAVLPIIVNLLLTGHAKEEQREQIKELTLVFLSDLTILLNSNNDNKRYNQVFIIFVPC